VLFLDLDRFKLVNDQHGHLVGSQVLRRLSEVLLQCIRQVDTLARYGGDEFTILLVDTGIEEGLAVGERIRRTVAATVFEGSRGAPIRLTLSVGVAAYPTHGREHEALLDLADKAMYRAKSLGRNCVCSPTTCWADAPVGPLAAPRPSAAGLRREVPAVSASALDSMGAAAQPRDRDPGRLAGARSWWPAGSSAVATTGASSSWICAIATACSRSYSSPTARRNATSARASSAPST
jgi:diguanylate cyclase (GGDEF)-like protein